MHALLLTLCLVLSGCALKESTPKPATYTLESSYPSQTAPSVLPHVLKIAPMDAPSGLQTRHILYWMDGALKPYKYGLWSEFPSQKLSLLLGESLQRYGRFGAVIPAHSMAAHSLLLESTLLHCEERFTSASDSFVALSVRFRILEAKTGKMLGTTLIEIHEAIQDPSGSQGVSLAFNKATTQMLSQLNQWITVVITP